MFWFYYNLPIIKYFIIFLVIFAYIWIYNSHMANVLIIKIIDKEPTWHQFPKWKCIISNINTQKLEKHPIFLLIDPSILFLCRFVNLENSDFPNIHQLVRIVIEIALIQLCIVECLVYRTVVYVYWGQVLV